MSLLWTYEFEDGTKRILVNEGLSEFELELMIKLHGKVIIGIKN